MSKVTDFYVKTIADENAKKELIGILGGEKLEEASDEQLLQIGTLANKLGFDITLDEAKAYLNPDNAELDEDDLEAVAGGKGGGSHTIYMCSVGGQAGVDDDNFGPNASQRIHK